ncbi:MAG TPA: ATP phosphoribosyltransferase [Gammaproteobacteria bacterium]|nr:ATP phosphoribosyltransferase [Gammaproteobacteria bacterium]HPI96534.1 ATP phosphoribosyltransferase [Gammaproteobacteria bacterium]HPQ87897.1 ATP phosphoribosyltransferase [Gammaproteobacteria bacterium]
MIVRISNLQLQSPDKKAGAFFLTTGNEKMKIKLAIPKGKLQEEILKLLAEVGLTLQSNERNYRPLCSDPQFEIKLLKSQNIPKLVELGQHDIGFCGLDWIAEQKADVEILKPLGFDPVKIVACIPDNWDYDELKKRKIIVATEYKTLSEKFLSSNGFNYKLIRSYGATEVFPPEDADMIIDNTSTGTTIVANHLKIVDTLYESSTQFIANKNFFKNQEKMTIINDVLVLIDGVLNGRKMVLLEMNATESNIGEIVDLLPAMRSPTVSQLYNSSGFSVKAAVMRNQVKSLIPQLLKAGATDILETAIRKAI